ncbi:MAG TPA: hypothetical protein VGJ93_02925 [Desulfuromonadaceae bacterium]|jgi:flavorubredoxin
MKTRVDEIRPGLYRFSTYVAKINLEFNQFLVDDDQPLLYHTGLRGMFPLVKEAVASVLDLARIRWIGFSHFEADECGSLPEWLDVAPTAEPVCGAIGALININDFIGKKTPVMANNETFTTGRYRFRFLETPHVPHAWDASLLFEETEAILFCSDLFFHSGNKPPLTEENVVELSRQTLLEYEAGPLHHSMPATTLLNATLKDLAKLKPRLLAIMHGSSYSGDGAEALFELAAMATATFS